MVAGCQAPAAAAPAVRPLGAGRVASRASRSAAAAAAASNRRASHQLSSSSSSSIDDSSSSFGRGRSFARPCAPPSGRCAPPRAAAAPPSAAPSSGTDRAWFFEQARRHTVVPLYERFFSDGLTPTEAYRRLVAGDAPGVPSFLFESVNNEGGADGAGRRAGRYSFVGARPAVEVIARGREVQVRARDGAVGAVPDVRDGEAGGAAAAAARPPSSSPPAPSLFSASADPLAVVSASCSSFDPASAPGLPPVFAGGWVGYAGYDSVRYCYAESRLGFSHAPEDDRKLPDVHLSRYDDVIIFDDADKVAYVVAWAHVEPGAPDEALQRAYDDALARLASAAARLDAPPEPRPRLARVLGDLSRRPASPGESNMTKEAFLDGVERAKEHMRAGDIFQLVFSQRFERQTKATPFEIYRSLRVVNPSPYMAYLQTESCTLVASSPEILCRVDASRTVTNRPLAGTRRRGRTAAEDAALEAELRADPKETAEHVMLVDLGRNDVGRVAEHGTVEVAKLMEVERYSHVMHISSTVVGTLKPSLTAWDALRAALPVGTISGAPKVRAMQLIDELEPTKRGPYGGGIGYVGYGGTLDMCLALRTLVVPGAGLGASEGGDEERPLRKVHLQTGAGLVADSVPEAEYEETVNKAAALGRAIDLAEETFVGQAHQE